MKPRMLTPLDPVATQALVLKKIKALASKAGCNVGDTESGPAEHLYFISLENDGKLGFDMACEIRKIDGITVTNVKEYDGTYSWRADTFIRPASVISYKMGAA